VLEVSQFQLELAVLEDNTLYLLYVRLLLSDVQDLILQVFLQQVVVLQFIYLLHQDQAVDIKKLVHQEHPKVMLKEILVLEEELAVAVPEQQVHLHQVILKEVLVEQV
tara:strand:- start:2746 stop:3069 length:324 start_codon:yes stop_codon:yes gene_type:complete